MHGAETLISMDWFRDFQGLIGALIGFTGVIATMLFNAKQLRKQHQIVIDHEAKSVRVALSVEIEKIITTLESLEERCKNASPEVIGVVDQLKISVSIYETYQSKIALLTEKEIAAVIKAYIHYDKYLEMLDLCTEYSEISLDNKLSTIDRGDFSQFLSLNSDFMIFFAAALKELKSN